MITNVKYNFLVQQYKNRIYNYSLYLLKNRMDADDITQEVLIRIWKNIGNFKTLSAKSWIMKTTHNLCIDFIRKNKNEFEKNPLSIEDVSNFLESKNEQNPTIILENKLTDERIKKAIKKLKENQKSVFVLYELQQMKYKEISNILNIPINSVKVYLMRARKNLQKELEQFEL